MFKVILIKIIHAYIQGLNFYMICYKNSSPLRPSLSFFFPVTAIFISFNQTFCLNKISQK